MLANKELYETINFYKDFIERIKKEDLNLFDISINEIKDLIGDNIFTNFIVIILKMLNRLYIIQFFETKRR